MLKVITIYLRFLLLGAIIMLVTPSCMPKPEGKHLFVLSGQSNMARLKPTTSFVPKIQKRFGTENVIVVKNALGGQPISRWYKGWKPLEGEEANTEADLYETLIDQVFLAIQNNNIETVTFIWMQGERDAREKHGEVYEESLRGLYQQLSNDLQRNDVNFVIGRLSDFDLQNEKYQHWTKIREVQVKVAESDARFDWVNTDDLNDGFNAKGKIIKNDLHMSVKGYVTLGERFAKKSIELIEKTK